MLGLPHVAELRDGAVLAVGNEHRLEAEALDAARRVGDPALEDPRPARLAPVRCERDELRDVAGPPVARTVEVSEQLGDRRRALRGVPRRVDSGAAVERPHLDPRVLADRPALAIAGVAPEERLRAGVLVVRLPCLGGPLVGVERVDRPARQQPLELARLVRVARGEDGSPT